MPELPEVETIRRDLQDKIIGKTIVDLEIRAPKIIKSPLPDFIKIIKNNAFSEINRRAKLLIFHFKKGQQYLLLHLKMTGQLIYVDKKLIIAGGHTFTKQDHVYPNKHTHVIFTFKDGAKLYFSDMRKFGFLKMVNAKEKNDIVGTYGIEPLTADFTFDRFQKIIKNRQTNIKAVLLNQTLIGGIGNIYADESCFLAGIKPTTPVAKISKPKLTRLFQACTDVLALSIQKRGTSFNSFRDGHGQKGNFLDHLKVYGRDGEKCLNCQTIIKKMTVAGRGTCYCPKCQN